MPRCARFIGPRVAGAGLVVGLVLLGGCNIDWLHAFGSNQNNNGFNGAGGTATPVAQTPVDQTNVSGFDVAPSSAGLTNTFDGLQTSVMGQTGRVQQFAFQTNPAGANGATTRITNNSATATGPIIGTSTASGTAIGVNTGTTTATGITPAGSRMGTNTTAIAAGTTIGTGATGSGFGSGSPGTNAGAGPGTATTGSDTGAATTSNNSANPRSARLIIFDNPATVTPILRADPRAGLDLPPRLLVFEDGDGNVGVAYNDTAYLAARYRLANASSALARMADNLATLAQEAAGNGVSRKGSTQDISQGEGIVAKPSRHDFATTLARLTAALDRRAQLELVDRIDNRQAANSIGLSLNPSVLLIFTDSRDDPPIVGLAATAAIDLPQKILVAENDQGQVTVYYNNPAYIAQRHHASNKPSQKLAATLAAVADTAAGS